MNDTMKNCYIVRDIYVYTYSLFDTDMHKNYYIVTDCSCYLLSNSLYINLKPICCVLNTKPMILIRQNKFQ